MESQTQNPEFRINPENFHPCAFGVRALIIFMLNLARGLLIRHCRTQEAR